MDPKTFQKALLSNPDKRQVFVLECVKALEEEVESKRGLSAIALKGAYRALAQFTPHAIYGAIDNLIDEFAEQVLPSLCEFAAQKNQVQSLSDFWKNKSDAIAESLLKVTDKRANSLGSSPLLKLYRALRPQAKKHVKAALPRLATLLETHYQKLQMVTPTGIEPVSAT